MARKGFDASGKSALVVGNGGVGSPIAASLVDDGMTRIGLFDPFIQASEALAERMNKHYPDVEVVDRIQGSGRIRPGGQRDAARA